MEMEDIACPKPKVPKSESIPKAAGHPWLYFLKKQSDSNYIFFPPNTHISQKFKVAKILPQFVSICFISAQRNQRDIDIFKTPNFTKFNWIMGVIFLSTQSSYYLPVPIQVIWTTVFISNYPYTGLYYKSRHAQFHTANLQAKLTWL
jgi:hypothetical protein